jgi:uncharacterized protein (TIGR02594 family)
MAINYVIPTALRMRQAPGAQFNVIGFLKKDEKVEVLDYKVNTDYIWKKVRTAQGLTGWCMARFLAKEEVPVSNPRPLGMHRTTINSLTVREKPSSTSRALYTLRPEEMLDVSEISPDGKWKRVETARGLRGWVAAQFITSMGDEPFPLENEEFPWMKIALGELTIREFPGKAARNPRIIEYLMSTTLEHADKLGDEVDWCSCYVNWVLLQANIEPTRSAMVNPWLRWGQVVAEPRRGVIAIYDWGHVGFYLNESGPYVRSLGGNQSDAVWISSYERTKVLAYRLPPGYPTL